MGVSSQKANPRGNRIFEADRLTIFEAARSFVASHPVAASPSGLPSPSWDARSLILPREVQAGAHYSRRGSHCRRIGDCRRPRRRPDGPLPTGECESGVKEDWDGNGKLYCICQQYQQWVAKTVDEAKEDGEIDDSEQETEDGEI